MTKDKSLLFPEPMSLSVHEKLEIIKEHFPIEYNKMNEYKDKIKKENNLDYKETMNRLNDYINLWINEKDPYLLKKEEIEQEWFRHNRAVSYVRFFDNKYHFYKAKDAKEYFKNVKIETEINGKLKKVNFFDIWSEDVNIRTYEDIIFNPDPNFNDKRYLNTFDGFSLDNIEPEGNIEDNISSFIKLIKHVFVDDVGYNYFLSWMNHILNKPHIKTDRAIVLYSEVNGLGKNSIVELCLKLIDMKYVSKIENIEHLTKQFNANMENKFFIYGDEIKARARGLANELKSIITRSNMVLEKKNQDPVYIPDYNNYIFTTNNEMAFKLDETDRRYFMVECPDEKLKDEDYKNFYDDMNNKNKLISLFKFIKNLTPVYDVKFKNPPVNNYKQRIMNESMPAYYQIFYKNLDLLLYEDGEYTTQQFMDEVKKFCKNNYLNQEFTMTKVGTALYKLFSEFCLTKQGGQRVYVFREKQRIKKILYGYNPEFYKLHFGEYVEKQDKKPKNYVIEKSPLD